MSTQFASIILVEDDDGHAVLVEKNLRRAGVTSAFVRLRDGQEALDYFFPTGSTTNLTANFTANPTTNLAANLTPALTAGNRSGKEFGNCVVLLDVNMPKIDGIEVLRRLKANPATVALPVIMLTTTDDPREIERCYELGCNIYVTKPVEYDAFIEAVRRLGNFLQVVKVPHARAASPT